MITPTIYSKKRRMHTFRCYIINGKPIGHKTKGAKAETQDSKHHKKTVAMSKTSKPSPPNGPSTTGRPSGGGRGKNPPAPKPSK